MKAIYKLHKKLPANLLAKNFIFFQQSIHMKQQLPFSSYIYAISIENVVFS